LPPRIALARLPHLDQQLARHTRGEDSHVLGIAHGPEWLRHRGTSLAYAASGDLKAIARMLGHTSTRTVDDVYVQLYRERTREIADAADELVRAARS